jgi:hypothetical protein
VLAFQVRGQRNDVAFAVPATSRVCVGNGTPIQTFNHTLEILDTSNVVPFHFGILLVLVQTRDENALIK